MTASTVLVDENVYLTTEQHRTFLSETGIRRFSNRMTTVDMMKLWAFMSVLFIPVGFAGFMAYAVAFTLFEINGWVGFAVFMSLAIIIGSSAYIAWTRLQAERRLEREGIAVPGTIQYTEITTTFTPLGWRPIVILKYEFTHPVDGNTLEGRYVASVNELPAARLPKPGQKVAIWFHDAKLHRIL